MIFSIISNTKFCCLFDPSVNALEDFDVILFSLNIINPMGIERIARKIVTTGDMINATSKYTIAVIKDTIKAKS